MNQKNHHFLFPQTHFGSIESFEEEFLENQEDEDDEADISHVSWTLVLEPDKMNQFEPKIGLFIHWIDPFNL